MTQDCPYCNGKGRITEYAPIRSFGAAHFTPNEGIALAILMTHRGQVVPNTMLYEALYRGTNSEADINGLKVLITRIRKKLRETDMIITTVWGTGYRLEMPEGGIHDAASATA
jgi:DNA-binding response OmpR family regulator